MDHYQTYIYGALCTPCLYGENTAKLKNLMGHKNASCFPGCVSYIVTYMSSFICGSAFAHAIVAPECVPVCGHLCSYCGIGLYASENRKQIRRITGLPVESEACDDCAMHAFCSPCAVCEESIALDTFEKVMIETNYDALPSAPPVIETMEKNEY